MAPAVLFTIVDSVTRKMDRGEPGGTKVCAAVDVGAEYRGAWEGLLHQNHLSGLDHGTGFEKTDVDTA